MPVTVEAIYKQGVFKPLHEIALPEGQKVRLRVEPSDAKLTPEEMLRLAQRVYEGLSEERIAGIEKIALDRSSFFRRRDSG
jgi:predicted DNA-binding antitoxin AbrB/MazE fold protein